MPEGSITCSAVLERGGTRKKEPFFTLDTCLVVDRVQSLPARTFDESSYRSDIFEDTALSALYTEGAGSDLVVHTGHTRAQVDVFSFVPARISVDAPSLFARPAHFRRKSRNPRAERPYDRNLLQATLR
jgi:hypothetical protein